MDTNSHSFQFKDKIPLPRFGVALMFDIEGFSRFFSQHDVEYYVPRFLNHAFRCMSLITNGGSVAWLDAPRNWPETNAPWPSGPTSWPALPAPVHTKFLGDGALYVWELGNGNTALSDEQVQDLFFRLSIMRQAFPGIMQHLGDDIPVADVPVNIRFGMSAGSIYRLNYAYSGQAEYLGYTINLASRLQTYCPEIGFITSARVEIPSEQLSKAGFIRVIAEQLKGFSREVVVVRESSYNKLSEERRNFLFSRPSEENSSLITEFPSESIVQDEEHRKGRGGA